MQLRMRKGKIVPARAGYLRALPGVRGPAGQHAQSHVTGGRGLHAAGTHRSQGLVQLTAAVLAR